MSEVKMIQPVLLPQGDWHRRLRAPFYGYEESISTGFGGCTSPSLHASLWLYAFVTNEPEPKPNRRRAVLDRDGWIVYGYATEPDFMEKYGHPAWFGSEMGFAIVESFDVIDPIELMMRESVAREAVDVKDWWKT